MTHPTAPPARPDASRCLPALRALAYGLVLCLPTAFVAAASVDDEVKAAYLLRFTEFVQWPALPGDRPVLQICVLGRDPVQPVLERLTADYRVDGREIEAVYLDRVEDASGCEVVFLPSTQSGRLAPLRAVLREEPVLIVGNSPGLAEAGAAINLFRDGPRLRFEINPDALDAAGLKASSRLLKLAVIRR
jgi:hypothetical protein